MTKRFNGRINDIDDFVTERQSNSTSSQLYESIVEDIQARYDGKLSKKEANIAARNLIEFVK